MNHVYTHPTKPGGVEAIQKYLNMIPIRYGNNYRVVFFRTDGETSLGRKFDQMMTEKGITVEKSAPYTPEQNGNAERAGRSITTFARTMRINANLPHDLWPEIVKAAGYLINRMPTKGLGWKSPFEEIFGKEATLNHLKAFGCKAFAHIPKEKRPRLMKLDPRAQIGYLVGYESRNSWRIWSPTEQRVFTTRDVIFDENNLYHPDQQNDLQLVESAEPAPTIIEIPEPENGSPDVLFDSTDEEDEDTIVVSRPHCQTRQNDAQNSNLAPTVLPPKDFSYLPTPEESPAPPSPPLPSTNSPKQVRNTAPKALEIGGELILPEGTKRQRKQPRKYAITATV
jgi:hypothetical protein